MPECEGIRLMKEEAYEEAMNENIKIIYNKLLSHYTWSEAEKIKFLAEAFQRTEEEIRSVVL